MRHMTFDLKVREAFSNFFNNTKIYEIIEWAKTLSKRECLYVFNYLAERKPKVIVEFGTQYGCSSLVFLKACKFLKIKTKVHSFDIVDERKPMLKEYKNFTFHKKDMTGKMDEVLKLKPDLIYIDVHKYKLIDELIKMCKKEKIDFMMHDTARMERCQEESKDFTDTCVRTTWESFFAQKLHKGKEFYKTKTMSVETGVQKSGVTIVRWLG